MATKQWSTLAGRHLLWLGILVVALAPGKRAEGAFASASNQAEFNIALAQYADCMRSDMQRQCWNLVLDPLAIGEAIVSVQFETDAVATSPDAIELTGLNQYLVDPSGGIDDLGNNISELHSILVIHPGIPPEGPVNILDLSFEVNPNFTRDSARFIVEVSDVTTVEFTEDNEGNRILVSTNDVPFDMVVQPDPVTIPVVPEPSTFAMFVSMIFGLIPLRRAQAKRRVAYS